MLFALFVTSAFQSSWSSSSKLEKSHTDLSVREVLSWSPDCNSQKKTVPIRTVNSNFKNVSDVKLAGTSADDSAISEVFKLAVLLFLS